MQYISNAAALGVCATSLGTIVEPGTIVWPLLTFGFSLVGLPFALATKIEVVPDTFRERAG